MSRGTYGSHRVFKEPKLGMVRGFSRQRVERLMLESNIRGGLLATDEGKEEPA
jgi:hypothetical protein